MPSSCKLSTCGPGALTPTTSAPALRSARSCGSSKYHRLSSVVVRCTTFGAVVTRRDATRPVQRRRALRDAVTMRALLDDSGFWLGAAVAGGVVALLALVRLV